MKENGTSSITLLEPFEHVELPAIAVPDDYPESKLCLLKLPTFLTLQPKPYEPETLQLGDVTEFEEEDQTVASARVSCTARWKISPDAKDIFNLSYKDMISNANLVQWSDDSYSIVIGTEIYDLNIHPTGKDEHIHVFTQHQSASLMEDVGTISQKIFLRPVGTSSTMTNRVTRTQAESKVKMAFMPQDPEAARVELEKIAIEKQKMKQKQEAEQRKYEQKQLKKESIARSNITKEWLEDDEIGKPTIRKRGKSSYDEDEEDEEEEDEEDAEYDGTEDDSYDSNEDDESEDATSDAESEYEEVEIKEKKKLPVSRKILSDGED